jgi:lambda family phage portal protein
MKNRSLLERAIGYVAPEWGLRRQRARVASDLLQRAAYDAASVGRRTSGWRRTGADAEAAAGPDLANLRAVTRDLVRNNAHAASAVATLADDIVGWGITPTPKPALTGRALEAWKDWAETPACDADGRDDLYGLQKLAVRTLIESGEVLIRQRPRTRPQDLESMPIPMQLQVLEPDYLDTLKTGIVLPDGGRITHGVEFDPIGRRRGYWLFREHPGAEIVGSGIQSYFVPAAGVLHVYHRLRPGQVRGVPWFAPVMLKLRDYDDYDDAQLMKQKVAACLAVITTDVTGGANVLGTADPANPTWDRLSPGMIYNAPAGQDVEVVQPPRVEGYRDYAEITLRTIAAGLGTTYESLTGDFTDLPFSAARMSRLQHWGLVQGWRWRTVIPQLCDPVWAWSLEVMAVMGLISPDRRPRARWTAPPMPMVDPAQEGLAYQRNVRSGIMTLSEEIRERGYDPDEMLQELAGDFEKLDALDLVLDIDPRKMTQAGQAQSLPSSQPEPVPPAPPEPDDDDQRQLRFFAEPASPPRRRAKARRKPK